MRKNYGFCECGCGEKTTIPGWNDFSQGRIKGIPMRYISGHHPRKYNQTSYTVNINGCWIWNGKPRNNGYGEFYKDGSRMAVHRYFYQIHKGMIPEGFSIDHLCRNRGCVNPDHLEAVTGKENILRGIGITALNSRKTHCIRGHEFSHKNTYIDPDGNRNCKECRRIRDRKYYREKKQCLNSFS